MTSTLDSGDLGKKKNKGGRPASSIWDDITKGNHVGSGKYHATCKYCNFSWSRGDISKLVTHLANHCSEAPAPVVRKYLTEMLEREDNTNKKRKVVDNNQLTMTDYHDSKKIPNGKVTRINRALAKFFVACGISFRVVEHPFFINFVKELNSAYELPTREFLSDQLLERELAMVNSNVTTVIENGTNLTLGNLGFNILFSLSNILNVYLNK
jgi:hypothetical protein